MLGRPSAPNVIYPSLRMARVLLVRLSSTPRIDSRLRRIALAPRYANGLDLADLLIRQVMSSGLGSHKTPVVILGLGSAWSAAGLLESARCDWMKPDG